MITNKKNIFLLFTLCLGGALILYLSTFRSQFGGYEQETAQVALKFLRGEYNIGRAGFGAVMLYFPFIWLFRILGLDLSVYNLTVVPIFYSALTAALFYLIGYNFRNQNRDGLMLFFWVSLGSTLWPYSNLGMEYQTAFYVALILLTLQNWRREKSLLLVGFILGILSIAKSYGVIFCLPAFLYIFTQHPKVITVNKESIGQWCKLFLPVILLFGGGLLLNYLLSGKFSGPYNLIHEFQIGKWWEGFYGVFFSAGKSIFLFVPALIVSCFYWLRFYREYKAEGRFILCSFVLLLLITAPFLYWSDEIWGVRKLAPILPFLLLPLLYTFNIVRLKFKVLLLVVFILGAYIQFLGAIYPSGRQLNFMRRADADSLVEMRYNPQFSHVYLFHRFFTSYLNNAIFNRQTNFVYLEKSWFRWTIGQPDRKFVDINFNLTDYERPRIWWLDNRVENGWIKLSVLLILTISIYLSLYLYGQKQKT